MKVTRLTNSSTQPLYQLRALTNDQAERLNNMTDSQLYDFVEPYNFGGAIKARYSDMVTIQVFVD